MDNFIAPEPIELELVEYCLNVLELPFSGFWYSWFPSNKEPNCTVHINSNIKISKEKLQETFIKLSFVESLFKIIVLSLPGYAEFSVQHYIHFKIK